MTTRIKIRGIYSTALTKLTTDWGYTVVQSSAKVQERFGLEPLDLPYDLLILDREDLQGIELSGEPEKLCQFLTFLQERLLDAVLLDLDRAGEREGQVKALLEIPGAAKQILDEARLSVTPTLNRHHRLRIIDAKTLEHAEAGLQKAPDRRESIEDKLFLETILLPLEKSGTVRLEHIRPSGKPMRPREGALMSANKHRIAFKRTFSSGHYDGLDLPIQHGDYGITEIEEGSWVVRHAYFTKENQPIGEYFNINTPVELYPYGARYLDLEVDVIRREGEEPFMIDQEKLALLSRQGCIGSGLEAKAMEVAESLMERLLKD